MSLSLVQVPLKKVLAPTINIGAPKSYVIAKGAKENTYQRFPAQNLNPNQITITCNPPSRDIVVNRRAYLRAKFTLTITGTPGASTLMVNPGQDAPRAFPLARALNTLQVSINNDQYSSTVNQYWVAFLRYYNKRMNKCNDFSATPSMLDQYQEYNDWADPYTGGSSKNALSGYGETSEPEGNRAGFSNWVKVSDSAGTAVYTLEVIEPIFMSPFLFQEDEESGFLGIQNMSITVSFGELASALYSHNNSAIGASTISGITVNVDAFEALFNYQSLPADIQASAPSNNVYSYFETVPYSTPAQSISANNSATITLNSVQLKTIPRRVYIFARENLNDLLFSNGGINKTDTFGVIENANLSLNNKVGLLSTANSKQLYDISRANGLQMSWTQWSKFTGSVLCLDFSKDLSLDDTLANGVLGNFQFGGQITVRNPRPAGGRAVNYTLWMVVVNEGVMNIVNGSVSHQVGVFNNTDVINTPVDENLTWNQQEDVYGGAVPAFLANAIPFLMNAWKVASPFVKGAMRAGPMVANLMDAVGLEKGGVRSGGVLMEGGKMMSRRELRDRM